MLKRKCFCADCDGKLRSRNTVKRHRTLQGIVPFDLSDQASFQDENRDSSDEELVEKVVPKVGHEETPFGEVQDTCSSTEDISGKEAQ